MNQPLVPLALRVPNPPTVFVGREEALAAFIAAARRGPVAALTGPQGIGKTALLLQALHKGFARKLVAFRYIRLGAGSPAEAVLQALAGDLRGEDWVGLLADPQAAMAAALDQAEAQEAWVVLDADAAEQPEAVVAWVLALAHFARRSRWLVTTRAHIASSSRLPTGETRAFGTLPDDEQLRAQVVALGGLAEGDLRALAARVAPDRDAADVAWALHVAGGSPGWFRQALEQAPEDRELQRNLLKSRMIPALGAADAEALVGLAVAEIPVPRPRLSAEGCARLQAAGWLESGPAGLQVASVPRAQLAAVTPPEAWRQACKQTAEDLAAEPGRVHAIEALRLWLVARSDRAAAWLEAVGDGLVAGGYAGRLWGLLAAESRPELDRWRLRAAVEAGVSASVELVAPTDGRPETRFEWARVLGQRGELARAVEVADAVAAEAPALAEAAGLLAARCLLNLGRIEAALDRLGGETGPQATDPPWLFGLPATVMRTTCRVVLGRSGAIDDARALVERVALSGQADALQVRLPIALLFYRVGRLREAEAVFDQLLRDEAMAPLALLRPEIAFVHFAVRLARGRLDDAARRLERSIPLRADSLWGMATAVGRAALRIARGDVDALGLEALAELAAQKNRLDFSHFAYALREDVARLLAVDAPLPPTGPAASAYYTAYLALHHGRRCARAGVDPPPVPALDHPDCAVLGHLLRADEALGRGEARAAREAAHEALALARDHGFTLHEAEALELLADAEGVLGARSAAREAAAALASLADAMPSPRHQAAAAIRRWLAAPEPDYAALEALAQGPLPLPAVRRARALLGADDVPLDRVDAVVLGAVSWPRPMPRGPWRPSFGVDEARQRVWLPDGTWVELQGRPQLWKLLAALLDGEADKETLVGVVWQEADYHPLRHDNRLHATVRNLRLALGDTDPPTRILTTEAGYRLAPGVRRLKPTL